MLAKPEAVFAIAPLTLLLAVLAFPPPFPLLFPPLLPPTFTGVEGVLVADVAVTVKVVRTEPDVAAALVLVGATLEGVLDEDEAELMQTTLSLLPTSTSSVYASFPSMSVIANAIDPVLEGTFTVHWYVVTFIGGSSNRGSSMPESQLGRTARTNGALLPCQVKVTVLHWVRFLGVSMVNAETDKAAAATVKKAARGFPNMVPSG